MPWHCWWIMVTSGWIFAIIIESTGGCFLSVDNHVFLYTTKTKQKYKLSGGTRLRMKKKKNSMLTICTKSDRVENGTVLVGLTVI